MTYPIKCAFIGPSLTCYKVPNMEKNQNVGSTLLENNPLSMYRPMNTPSGAFHELFPPQHLSISISPPCPPLHIMHSVHKEAQNYQFIKVPSCFSISTTLSV